MDETDVVTRSMPTGEDVDGNILYLPELYIDSPNLGAYTHPKWIHLAVSEAKEVTDGDAPKSKDQCYAELRNAAHTEYEYGCDLPTVTLKVDFVNFADTEEYRQYRFLQYKFLGDSVRVVARRIGVAVSLRMTQYTYDCLTQKYTAMTLGTAADTLEGSMISARQLASGTITGMKLALELIRKYLPEGVFSRIYLDEQPTEAGSYVGGAVALESGVVNTAGMAFFRIKPKSAGVRVYWAQELPASMTAAEALNYNVTAVVESDGQVVEGGKVTYTYKKKSGLFDFLGTTQSGFPTEPGEYVQTAKAAGNYSSSEISRTIVIQ